MERKETGHFLQKVYASLAPELQRQSLNGTALSAMYFNPQDIDRMVQIEIKRIKENYLLKEQQYVEEMLLENPIIIDRCVNNNGTVDSSSGITYSRQQYSDEDIFVFVSAPKKTDSNEQQKWAEICRRSHLNNKIRKAKSKHRQEYMATEVLQSSLMFNSIQNLIERAENHLFNQGLPHERLQHLRHSFGVDISINKLRRWRQHVMEK